MFGDCFWLLSVVISYSHVPLFFMCQIHVSGGYAVDLILACFENVSILFVLLGVSIDVRCC
jgi:hypothetical protein